MLTYLTEGGYSSTRHTLVCCLWVVCHDKHLRCSVQNYSTDGWLWPTFKTRYRAWKHHSTFLEVLARWTIICNLVHALKTFLVLPSSSAVRRRLRREGTDNTLLDKVMHVSTNASVTLPAQEFRHPGLKDIVRAPSPESVVGTWGNITQRQETRSSSLAGW